MSEIQKFAAELHHPIIKKFKRRKIIIKYLWETLAIDIVQLDKIKEYNDDYPYFLNAIDCFSRYAFAVPLRTKGAAEVLEAMKKIVKEMGTYPEKIWCDMGKEFYNNQFKKWLKENNIEMYSTYSENKSSYIERFNRTLKNMMWKYFTAHQTYKWIDILSKLIDEYNNKRHSSIKMSPKQATETKGADEIQNEIEKELYTKEEIIPKPKFKVGDKVRISKVKGVFEKGYIPSWSAEIFEIAEVKKTNPITYIVKDDQNEIIKGSFYNQELLKSDVPDVFLIEKTIRSRTVKGKKQYLVKWLGFPDSKNEWIDEDKFIEFQK